MLTKCQDKKFSFESKEVKIKTPLKLKSVVMIVMNYLKNKIFDIFILKQNS